MPAIKFADQVGDAAAQRDARGQHDLQDADATLLRQLNKICPWLEVRGAAGDAPCSAPYHNVLSLVGKRLIVKFGGDNAANRFFGYLPGAEPISRALALFAPALGVDDAGTPKVLTRAEATERIDTAFADLDEPQRNTLKVADDEWIEYFGDGVPGSAVYRANGGLIGALGWRHVVEPDTECIGTAGVMLIYACKGIASAARRFVTEDTARTIKLLAQLVAGAYQETAGEELAGLIGEHLRRAAQLPLPLRCADHSVPRPIWLTQLVELTLATAERSRELTAQMMRTAFADVVGVHVALRPPPRSPARPLLPVPRRAGARRSAFAWANPARRRRRRCSTSSTAALFFFFLRWGTSPCEGRPHGRLVRSGYVCWITTRKSRFHVLRGLRCSREQS